MKLYGEDNPAPNPRRVRIFLAEKGMTLEQERVPLRERAHKASDFLEKNSLGQVPVLELDDGSFLSESVSICRYLEGLHPRAAAVWDDAERAGDDRHVDSAHRAAADGADRPHLAPYPSADGGPADPVQGLRRVQSRACRSGLSLAGPELADRAFIAGDAYSMADIVALTTIEFGQAIGVPIPRGCDRVAAWRERVAERPARPPDEQAFESHCHANK
jgi:glutathione S-transferase